MYYHAFACYNSKCTEDVEKILEYLENSFCHVFYDKRDIKPGDIHQTKIDYALKNSASLLVFIGPEGLGPWQKEEVLSGIWESIDRNLTIIPLVLPKATINHPEVPLFIKSRCCIEFKDSVENLNMIELLIERLQEIFKPTDTNGIERPIKFKESRSLIHNTISAYDNPSIAELFYEKWRNEIPEKKLSLFLEQIPHNGIILDAGCGPGHHTNYIHNQGIKVIGIDLSTASLEIARKICKRVDFHLMDMMNTYFSRYTFDGIWACASCIHTPREYFINQLLEYRRILKLGGILGLTLLIGKKAHIEKEGRFFEGWESPPEIIKYLDIAGFDVIGQESNLLSKSTFGGRRLSNWVIFLAQTRIQQELIIRPFRTI